MKITPEGKQLIKEKLALLDSFDLTNATPETRQQVDAIKQMGLKLLKIRDRFFLTSIIKNVGFFDEMSLRLVLHDFDSLEVPIVDEVGLAIWEEAESLYNKIKDQPQRYFECKTTSDGRIVFMKKTLDVKLDEWIEEFSQPTLDAISDYKKRGEYRQELETTYFSDYWYLVKKGSENRVPQTFFDVKLSPKQVINNTQAYEHVINVFKSRHDYVQHSNYNNLVSSSLQYHGAIDVAYENVVALLTPVMPNTDAIAERFTEERRELFTHILSHEREACFHHSSKDIEDILRLVERIRKDTAKYVNEKHHDDKKDLVHQLCQDLIQLSHKLPEKKTFELFCSDDYFTLLRLHEHYKQHDDVDTARELHSAAANYLRELMTAMPRLRNEVRPLLKMLASVKNKRGIISREGLLKVIENKQDVTPQPSVIAFTHNNVMPPIDVLFLMARRVQKAQCDHYLKFGDSEKLSAIEELLTFFDQDIRSKFNDCQITRDPTRFAHLQQKYFQQISLYPEVSVESASTPETYKSGI